MHITIHVRVRDAGWKFRIGRRLAGRAAPGLTWWELSLREGKYGQNTDINAEYGLDLRLFSVF